MNRRYFWFAYPTNPRTLRKPDHISHLDIHRLRDGPMMMSLSGVLYAVGYEYGGEILNFPARLQGNLLDSYPTFGPEDVLVAPTRLPLDDDQSEVRILERSNTELEKPLLAALRMMFAEMDRRHVLLSNLVRDQLSQPQQQYVDVDFEVWGGAGLKPPDGSRGARRDHTLAYLLTIPSVVQSVRLLAAFGIGGQQTLLFGQWLRCMPDLVRQVLESTQPRLLIFKFRSPEYVSYPYGKYELGELEFEKVADVYVSSIASPPPASATVRR